MFKAEELSGSGNAGLDFVADQQDVVLFAKGRDLAEVVSVWNNDTGLSLDGFDEEGSDFVASVLEGLFEVGDIVVAEGFVCARNVRADLVEVRAIVFSSLGVGGHGNDGNCSSVKVFSGTEDDSFAGLDSLLFVSPLASDFDGGLDSFSASVHGKNHFIVKELSDVLCKLAKDVIVESAGGEGEFVSLFSQCSDNLWMAMALVDGGVSGKKVEVLVSFGVPDMGAKALCQNYWERVVVMGRVFFIVFDGSL